MRRARKAQRRRVGLVPAAPGSCTAAGGLRGGRGPSHRRPAARQGRRRARGSVDIGQQQAGAVRRYHESYAELLGSMRKTQHTMSIAHGRHYAIMENLMGFGLRLHGMARESRATAGGGEERVPEALIHGAFSHALRTAHHALAALEGNLIDQGQAGIRSILESVPRMHYVAAHPEDAILIVAKDAIGGARPPEERRARVEELKAQTWIESIRSMGTDSLLEKTAGKYRREWIVCNTYKGDDRRYAIKAYGDLSQSIHANMVVSQIPYDRARVDTAFRRLEAALYSAMAAEIEWHRREPGTAGLPMDECARFMRRARGFIPEDEKCRLLVPRYGWMRKRPGRAGPARAKGGAEAQAGNGAPRVEEQARAGGAGATDDIEQERGQAMRRYFAAYDGFCAGLLGAQRLARRNHGGHRATAMEMLGFAHWLYEELVPTYHGDLDADDHNLSRAFIHGALGRNLLAAHHALVALDHNMPDQHDAGMRQILDAIAKIYYVSIHPSKVRLILAGDLIRGVEDGAEKSRMLEHFMARTGLSLSVDDVIKETEGKYYFGWIVREIYGEHDAKAISDSHKSLSGGVHPGIPDPRRSRPGIHAPYDPDDTNARFLQMNSLIYSFLAAEIEGHKAMAGAPEFPLRECMEFMARTKASMPGGACISALNPSHDSVKDSVKFRF